MSEPARCGRDFAVRPLLDSPRDRELVRRLLAACSEQDRLRRAAGADVEACLPWLLPRRRHDRALLAYSPHEPVGVVNANHVRGTEYELAVLVHPAWRRQNVGLVLLEAATAPLAGTVTALLRADNLPARRLAGRFLPHARWDWSGTDVECRAPLCPHDHGHDDHHDDRCGHRRAD